MAQTDVVDMINTGSLSEATVKARQNKVEAVIAARVSGNIDDKAASDVAKVNDTSALQKEADLAEVAFRTNISNETIKLEEEVRGVRETASAFRTQYDTKLAEHQKVLKEAEGLSFWRNPIATIRNDVVQGNQISELNGLASAIESADSRIDNSYAVAAQKINAYRATVLNKTQAELNLKSNEMRAGYAKAEILIQAEKDKNAIALGANRQQQFKVDDAQTKADRAQDTAAMENATNRYRWDVMNNHSGAPFTPAAAKQMEELRRLDIQSNPEAARLWSLAAARSNINGFRQRNDGETPAQYSEARINSEIAALGSVDGPAAAAVISTATTTAFNPIIRMAETVVASEEIDWEGEIGKLNLPVGTQPTAAQAKMIRDNHTTKQALVPQRERIIKAGKFVVRDMSEDFSRANSIPAMFDSAAENMKAIGASEPIVKFFSSDLARIAIQATPAKTGDSKKDLVIALAQAMEFSKTEGNLIPANQIPSAIAAYVAEAYKTDYGLGGKYANEYASFTKLMPDADIQVKIMSRDGKMDYANPVDIANMLARTPEAMKANSMQKFSEFDMGM